MNMVSGPGTMSAQGSVQQSREDRLMQGMNSTVSGGDKAKIDKGAKEFEAVLIGSWLQQAEQSFATVPGADEGQDPGGEQMMSLGVQSLSTSMAATGGFGIGKMIAKAMYVNAEKAGAQAEPAGNISETNHN